MTKVVLIIFTVIFPATTFAQEFKALSNPTIACSYGNPDNPIDWDTNKPKLTHYFFIVEEMPKPKVSVNEIENILNGSIFFTEKEITESQEIAFQCLVNCEGMAGDFQILECSAEMIDVSGKILDILRNNLAEWDPGLQRNKTVDVLIKIKLEIHEGQIKLRL